MVTSSLHTSELLKAATSDSTAMIYAKYDPGMRVKENKAGTFTRVLRSEWPYNLLPACPVDNVTVATTLRISSAGKYLRFIPYPIIITLMKTMRQYD